MNWTSFLSWLAGLYLLYYVVNFLLDAAKAKRSADPSAGVPELTFAENIVPVKLENDAIKSAPAPAVKPLKTNGVISSGGVGITDLFLLAKQEAIIYTQSVSF